MTDRETLVRLHVATRYLLISSVQSFPDPRENHEGIPNLTTDFADGKAEVGKTPPLLLGPVSEL